MSLAVAQDPHPVRLDAEGIARVGNTRVRLASVLFLHKQGATPEEIHERFPTVPLADVYASVAYYLHHRAEVDSYLAEHEAEAERVRQEVEARPATKRLRRTLRERQADAPRS